MSRLELGRLGWQGVVGVGVLLFGASFALGTLLPDRERLIELRTQEFKLSAELRANPPPQNDRPLQPPPLTEASDVLERFAAAGSTHQIALDQASYRLVRDNRLSRYEILVTTRASYPAIKDFLAEIAGLSPMTTIEELAMRRASATDAVIDVTLRIHFHFEGS